MENSIVIYPLQNRQLRPSIIRKTIAQKGMILMEKEDIIMKNKWVLFQCFKFKVAKLFGGKKRLKLLFSTSNERKQLYDALLYELKISGGKKNNDLIIKYKALAINYDLNKLVVNINAIIQEFQVEQLGISRF